MLEIFFDAERWDQGENPSSETSITVKRPMHCTVIPLGEYPGPRGSACIILRV